MNKPILRGLTAFIAFAIALPAQTPPATGPAPKSKAEMEALQAMFGAKDPDARITQAQNVITKFADSDFKPVALFFIAASYEQKNDFPNMVVYAERTIEADPKNYGAMLMLARGIASKTRENDLDKEEKLTRAEKYANSALDALKDAKKPQPQMPDDQWNAAKKDYVAQAHEALGISAMVRKKYDVAAKEFQTAVDTSTTPDPATMVRLAAADNQLGKYDDAITVLDKVMAAPDAQPAVKQFAQAEKVRATQGKAKGTKPADTKAAPPQVDIKP
ncbi:MAG: hypothetical protein M3Z85_08990 [Acidobacteriota bacterium]|nr:hypothetical protein [Acidobacteriota bacterium]